MKEIQLELLKLMQNNDTQAVGQIVDQYLDKDELAIGRALFYMFGATKDEKYNEVIVKLAGKYDVAKITKISDMFGSLPFYMQYDTERAGKGHYAEIIRDINNITASYFSEEIATDELEWYLLGLVDTIEVTSEQIFEYYMTLMQLFKKAFKVWVSRNVEANELMTYVISKACDLKVILREKYQKGC